MRRGGQRLETLLLKLVDIWKTDKDDDRRTSRIDLYLYESDRTNKRGLTTWVR